METTRPDTSAWRLRRVQAAFERAWEAGGQRSEQHYRLASSSVRLRIAGTALARHVQAPFAHLRLPSAPGHAPLTIDLWDVAATGVAPSPMTERHADGQRWDLPDGVFAASADASLVSHELRDSVVWLDRRDQHVVGWYADANRLSLHQRGKPLLVVLGLWAKDRGLDAIHAALVARDGRGALVPSKSGSGKSTVALACLAAGFEYIADDWIGIERSAAGAFRGHGFYSSTSLEPGHAERFPHLVGAALSPVPTGEQKSLVLLAPLYSDQLAGSADIRALILPRVVPGGGGRWGRASKKDALLRAVTSVFEMRPRLGGDGVERLTQLVHAVPAYWLEIGASLSDIPRQVDEILADAADG